MYQGYASVSKAITHKPIEYIPIYKPASTCTNMITQKHCIIFTSHNFTW